MDAGACVCPVPRYSHEPGPEHLERCPLYEAPGDDVCPDCLDPVCDGWCRDALANQYGVEVEDFG